MSDHLELVMEISLVEKMSTQERLKHAKKRRAQQLKRFNQYEKQLDKEAKKKTQNNKKSKKGKTENNNIRNRRVQFQNNIMVLEAAARNDLYEVQQMLESGVNPDVTNEDGLTALHQCCIDDCEDMMKLLIEYGANVNARDSELWTPLHAAATCNHLHLCKYLIEKGAELLAVNADGNMPYDICEDDVTLEYIESEMADKGVTQELIDETRLSPEKVMLKDLRQAAETSMPDLEIRDRNGATPIHVAAANGYLPVVEFLLDQHVTVDCKDNDGWQPIHAAACWGHPVILEILVQNGADIEAKTNNGETPYDICEDAEMRDRISEIKVELETNKAVRSLESRYRQRHSNRSAVSSASSIYNSNISLSEKNQQRLGLVDPSDPGYATSAVHSSSIRRVSMREKTAISWREAREEAKIRDSANTLNVDDEDDLMEKQDRPEKKTLQNPADRLPSSDLDEITVAVPFTKPLIQNKQAEQPEQPVQTPTPTENSVPPSQIFMEMKGTPSPKSKKKIKDKKDSTHSVEQNNSNSLTVEIDRQPKQEIPLEPEAKSKGKDTKKEKVEAKKEVKKENKPPKKEKKESKSEKKVETVITESNKNSGKQIEDSVSGENGKTTETNVSLGNRNDINRSLTSLDSLGANDVSGNVTKAPSGTLADLKKQRAQQLRNSQRYRGKGGTGDDQGGSMHGSNGENKSAATISNGQTGINSSTQEQPRHKFTAQKTEIVGAEEEKQQCCVIL